MAGPIFITGASGCVGHYVVEALLEDAGLADRELILLVRTPAKLRADLAQHPRVKVIQGDLLTIDKQAEVLKTVTTAILIATAWGGMETFQINVLQMLKLISFLDPAVCQQILYFSTASVLDRQNQPLQAAQTFGTDYIRTKFECAQRLKTLPLADRLTILYPTLVIGGSDRHPVSEVSRGIPEVGKYMGLARRLSVDGSFHFIHARDIAQIVSHLVAQASPEAIDTNTHNSGDNGDQPATVTPPASAKTRQAQAKQPQKQPAQLVLGVPALQANEAVDRISTYLFGRPARLKFPLSIALANLLIKVFKIQVGAWDRFSMDYRHFTYTDPVTPASFGRETFCSTIEDVFRLSGVGPNQKN